MSTYFTITELTHSETAVRLSIDNTPSSDAIARLEILAEQVLDPVRELLGLPLTVNSGYRSRALNIAMNGAAESQHMLGEAADITAGSRGANEELFEMIVASGLDFDQLIDESGYSWLHISYREGRNRRQILHL